MHGANQISRREDRLVAGLAALAISVHVLESALPMPLPGIKPGLANVIVLVVLMRYGISMAFAVSLLRIVVGSLFIGSFLTPTFFLSLAGGLASIGVGALLLLVLQRFIGPLGLGVAMSMAHISGQFLLAWWLFVPHPALIALLPVLLALAMGLGALTGIIAANIQTRLPTTA